MILSEDMQGHSKIRAAFRDLGHINLGMIKYNRSSWWCPLEIHRHIDVAKMCAAFRDWDHLNLGMIKYNRRS